MYFIESVHKYYKNSPDEVFKYISASSVAKKYSNDFDAEYWSLYKAYEFILYRHNKDNTLHIDDYIKNKPEEPKIFFKSYKRGYKTGDYKLFKHLRMYANEAEALKVQQYILNEWGVINKKSLFKGSAYHYDKELATLNEATVTNPFTGNVIPVINCNQWITPDIKKRTVDLNNLPTGFYSELILDSGLFLGQSDKLWVEDKDFWIGDYKTNNKIDFDNKYQTMKYPINHLDDCSYNHYRIQLGVYSHILEQYGYTCAGNRITHCIHDEETDLWDNINYDFDYIRKELNDIVMDLTIDF